MLRTGAAAEGNEQLGGRARDAAAADDEPPCMGQALCSSSAVTITTSDSGSSVRRGTFCMEPGRNEGGGCDDPNQIGETKSRDYT